MKAKSGFVLRDVVGEKILMPVGDNITKFNGTVLLNTVSAFVWEKLQEPASKEDLLLYGVPWDGKEQCFRNASFPLRAICEVRRADAVSVRGMSFSERRELLMSQCFIPMWDTDTALVQMENIVRLAGTAEIVRAYCGSSAEDAVRLYDMLGVL